MTPCPVWLFTFGLFPLITKLVALRLVVIPVGWSLIGGSTAFLLPIAQDWPLLVSGRFVLVMLKRDRDHRRHARERPTGHPRRADRTGSS